MNEGLYKGIKPFNFTDVFIDQSTLFDDIIQARLKR